MRYLLVFLLFSVNSYGNNLYDELLQFLQRNDYGEMFVDRTKTVCQKQNAIPLFRAIDALVRRKKIKYNRQNDYEHYAIEVLFTLASLVSIKLNEVQCMNLNEKKYSKRNTLKAQQALSEQDLEDVKASVAIKNEIVTPAYMEDKINDEEYIFLLMLPEFGYSLLDMEMDDCRGKNKWEYRSICQCFTKRGEEPLLRDWLVLIPPVFFSYLLRVSPSSDDFSQTTLMKTLSSNLLTPALLEQRMGFISDFFLDSRILDRSGLPMSIWLYQNFDDVFPAIIECENKSELELFLIRKSIDSVSSFFHASEEKRYRIKDSYIKIKECPPAVKARRMLAKIKKCKAQGGDTTPLYSKYRAILQRIHSASST